LEQVEIYGYGLKTKLLDKILKRILQEDQTEEDYNILIVQTLNP
jgi:hypothetical protein